MINKELLSAVLELHCGIKSIKNSEVIYWFDCIGEIREHSINIYELAHKCKEWAYSQGYVLFSKIRLNSSLASCYFDAMGKHDYEDDYHNDFRAETESEAIFKACQWILDKDSK